MYTHKMSFQTDFKIPASATNDIKYSTIFENCLKCETVGHKIDLLEEKMMSQTHKFHLIV